MIRFRTGRPTHRRRRMNPPAHPDNGRRTEDTAYIQYEIVIIILLILLNGIFAMSESH